MAAVVVLGAATVTVGASSPEVQGTVKQALNDVAVLTLGREGQNKTSGSPSPKPSPSLSASPCPSESPEAAEPASVGALPTADHGKPADTASEDHRPSRSPTH